MITLSIKPDVEALLHTSAQRRGLEPSVYASQLLAEALASSAPRVLSSQQLNAALDRLAALGSGLPRIPEFALTRESFYEDHD